ncbi:MAG: VIT1/CCC1 transporter family protein [Verrucomicrobiales bacterium]
MHHPQFDLPDSGHHREHHRVQRSGMIRAAVLGANDGILSVASLLMGVAAAQPEREALVLAGVAGLAAGAFSMAAGEYVSVKSQADIEEADLRLEEQELENHPEREEAELSGIYQERGLSKALADEVAREMTAHDALGAHARDEIGITEELSARPIQAALTSALTFAAGAALPLVTVLVVDPSSLVWVLPLVTIFSLAGLGAVSARAGGASKRKAACRVSVWGVIALGLSAAIGKLLGAGMP